MSMSYKLCTLCARNCKVNRESGEIGYCRMPAVPVVARASLHMWEEPPISGERGSGTIFFSGCSLGCVYCQNRDISKGWGEAVSEKRLSEIMLELERSGAHNINLVTPTHFVPSIRRAVVLAKEAGLDIPIVYNTASYDTPNTLRSLHSVVDIFLADFKYVREDSAEKYSNAKDYPSVAKAAIDEMVRLVGEPKFDTGGMMTRGVIVRILLLPTHLIEAKLALRYIYNTYGDKVYISLMSQYTPMSGVASPLDRRVSEEEYRSLISYAEELGVTNAFIQEGSAASESFIPAFDLSGVLPNR